MPTKRLVYVRPWAAVEVREGDTLILTGRVDALRRRIAKGEHSLTLTGRDGAGILLDCSAPILTQREVTVHFDCLTCVACTPRLPDSTLSAWEACTGT